jgi:hypothetical protein
MSAKKFHLKIQNNLLGSQIEVKVPKEPNQTKILIEIFINNLGRIVKDDFTNLINPFLELDKALFFNYQ